MEWLKLERILEVIWSNAVPKAGLNSEVMPSFSGTVQGILVIFKDAHSKTSPDSQLQCLTTHSGRIFFSYVKFSCCNTCPLLLNFLLYVAEKTVFFKTNHQIKRRLQSTPYPYSASSSPNKTNTALLVFPHISWGSHHGHIPEISWIAHAVWYLQQLLGQLKPPLRIRACDNRASSSSWKRPHLVLPHHAIWRSRPSQHCLYWCTF